MEALRCFSRTLFGDQSPSVQQKLTTPIVAGRTYRVSMCFRWLNNNNPILPKFVKFRLCASGAAPAAYPLIATYDLIGLTPATPSTAWMTHTFPDWTALNSASVLTINPENNSSVNHGDFVSWGQGLRVLHGRVLHHAAQPARSRRARGAARQLGLGRAWGPSCACW